MTPQQRQTALIERYSIIPDLHERLAALVSRRLAIPPLAVEDRTEAHLVRGCQSRVWIAGTFESGRCRFRMAGESALVNGLASLLCEICHEAAPEEIAALEPDLFEKLGLAGNLSPTRLNGLEGVRAHLREFALRHLDPAFPEGS